MFKRAQIEMIGLVIVVIILVIGLLLYVKFGVLRDEVKQDTTSENAYVINLMNGIFNLKLCEKDKIKVDEAIIKCFNEGQVCGEEACNYVKTELKTIIAEICIKKYKNYSIWITKGDNNRTIMNECKTGILAHTTIVASDKEHYTAYFRSC